MTDHGHDASPLSISQDGVPERASLSTDRQSRPSNDTDESSTTLRHSSIEDTTEAVDMAFPRRTPESRQSPFLSPDTSQTSSETRRRTSARSHRPKSSGGFLLPEPVYDGAGDNPSSGPRRRSNIPITQRGKTSARNHDASPSNKFLNPDLIAQDASPAGRDTTAYGTVKRRSASSRQPLQDAGSSPAGPGAAPTLDADSAQIVNMALNLSESRRLATKRNVSQPLPPRLAPLPDSAVGGSLKAQLQQQRRSSRNISPNKALKETRIGSSQRVSSPLQAAFDPNEAPAPYRYHFSESTLARAQKAKEHLELLAQNRRVLELLPPLKPSSMRSITASPPATPANPAQSPSFGNGAGLGTLGRAYNPLQYVRNRKVRMRERKTIDGAEQGFADVPKVTEWVDAVAKWAATGQGQIPGSTELPPFASADETAKQESPPSTLRNTTSATKQKRPRIDWMIDPADMLADVYWLEQDDNKRLVEDRHWQRVFPQNAELYRRMSVADTNDTASVEPPSGPMTKSLDKAVAADLVSLEQMPVQVPETKEVPATARERARQKLHDLKGHHRKRSSMHGDFLKFRKGSVSDSSGSDSDRRKMRRRTNTITATGRDILNKQMMEMIARDNRENQLASQQVSQLGVDAKDMEKVPQGLMTPPRLARGRESTLPSRGHSRRESRVEFSESDGMSIHGPRPGLESPVIKAGRPSLEVPGAGRRFSMDYDSSRPTSPELRAAHRDLGFVPFIGADLSPGSSRRSSPTRNPFSKVKSIFRDHSRERSMEKLVDDHDDTGATPSDSKLGKLFLPPTPNGGNERKASPSPPRKMVYRNTGTSHKSHRSVNSLRLREESSNGFRHFIRGGQRIDTVLRTGVSKVSDLFWRKDSTGLPDEDDTSGSSDDEQQPDEERRGRSRVSIPTSRGTSVQKGVSGGDPSKTPHHNSLPSFIPLSASKDDRSSRISDPSRLHLSPVSRTPSRRSSRFDRLKPPKIDVQNASPTSTPPQRQLRPSADVSDSDSRKSSYAADAGSRLNAVLALPGALNSRRLSSLAPDRRHWSISTRQRATSPSTNYTSLSRRDIARLRAMILSQGTMAREIARKADEPCLKGLPEPDSAVSPKSTSLTPLKTLHPTTARALTSSIHQSASTWQSSAQHLTTTLLPPLHARLGALRSTLAEDLDGAASNAAREADEIGRDLLPTQRLKARRVADSVEKLLRRRRRRFRWMRRAGWLGVEWALVGFMWYVWFVVMIARVVLGIGRGVVGVGRWLLWL